jgi:2-oxoglutarate dehydrogenase E2 component (dihydrolipoamide succinyltransferase)
MGESIAEGTVVRWIKKVGDPVERDEPLFEITTDKVDAEIPSPTAGVLAEISVHEGETVPVNSVVGIIAQAGEVLAPKTDGATAGAPPQVGKEAAAASTQPQPNGQPAKSTSIAPSIPVPPQTSKPATMPSPEEYEPDEADLPDAPDGRRSKSSPVVRRIAREHNVDISRVAGSGTGGRVTKHDILAYIQRGGADGSTAREAEHSGPIEEQHPADRVEIQPLSLMRKKIAEHMVMSRRTSAHVHTVFHVNFSHVEQIRQEKKDEYARVGVRLTYMAFIAKAVVAALRRYPIVNASLDGDNIVLKKDVNLGIAVALDSGLIVPVIRNADERNLLGLSRAIVDVAERARAKQLKPEEVHGGTFTITNPGQFGAQFGMPIINQPQVAILGVGTIEKRPVVVDDAIAIRTMAYLTLGFDHRLIDGAVADQFMSDIRKHIEEFDAGEA